MSRSLRFVSGLPWLLISACCASTAHQTGPAAAAAPAPSASAAAGDVPQDVIDQMKSDLVQQAGADAAATARVVVAERVMWPNGALGCPQPGRMYTQALVPGYRVEFEAGGRTYAYHASQKGGFVLCKRPALGHPPSSQQLR